MSLTVVLLRVISLLALASPMLLAKRPPLQEHRHTPSQTARGRLAVFANFGAVGVFFPILFVFAGSAHDPTALALVLIGCVIAATGSVIVWRSRSALGPAWSLLPKADDQTGLITTGPYRLVRHPIYLGFSMLTFGEAVAFSNALACLIVLACVAPSFLWRALEEEKVLISVFDQDYASYRRHTKLIIPYLL